MRQADRHASNLFVFPDQSVELPLRPKIFRNFVSFIKEKRTTLEQIDELLWAFVHVNKAKGAYDLRNWESYAKLFRDLYEEANPRHGLTQILTGIGLSSALAAAGGTVTPLVMEHLAGVSLGEASTGVLRAAVSVSGLISGTSLAGASLLLRKGVFSYGEREMAPRRLIVHRVCDLTDIPRPGGI